MKILVTGAAGFIGSYLSRALIWRGDDVVGIDNFHEYYPRRCKEFNLDLISLSSSTDVKFEPRKDVEPIYNQLEKWTDKKISDKRGSFEFHEVDIRNFEALKDLFNKHKIDVIVHLAAMAGVPLSLKQPRLYSSVNLDGTVNLLELASQSEIKNFVFASSSSVYGNANKVPFVEVDVQNKPISPYAASKLAGEVLCYTFHHNFKMPVSCLRFFTVYGPLQRPYGMAIQRFISQGYRGIPMSIYGDGSMARDYTYVEDTVSGIMGAVDNKLDYEIFNLGNSSPVTVLKLTEEIEKALGNEVKRDFIARPSTEVDITYADISKAKNLLNYNPQTNIQEGIEKQVEIYLKMPSWYREFESF